MPGEEGCIVLQGAAEVSQGSWAWEPEATLSPSGEGPVVYCMEFCGRRWLGLDTAGLTPRLATPPNVLQAFPI